MHVTVVVEEVYLILVVGSVRAYLIRRVPASFLYSLLHTRLWLSLLPLSLSLSLSLSVSPTSLDDIPSPAHSPGTHWALTHPLTSLPSLPSLLLTVRQNVRSIPSIPARVASSLALALALALASLHPSHT